MTTGAEPIILDYLRPRDWRQIARAAALLDISAGDYFDVRTGAINLWAGPKNKPTGWPREVRITPGSFIYPRALVGTLTYESAENPPDWTSAEVYPIMLQITCPEVQAWRRRSRAPGEAFVAWLERREIGRGPAAGRVDGDEAWCRRQWQRLKQYAEVGSVQ